MRIHHLQPELFGAPVIDAATPDEPGTGDAGGGSEGDSELDNVRDKVDAKRNT